MPSPFRSAAAAALGNVSTGPKSTGGGPGSPISPPQTHDPAWHVAALEPQAVPFGALGLEHVPVAGSHVPATWHCSGAEHTTGLDPSQTPAWHVSVCVHLSPSSHAAPSCSFMTPHMPPAHVRSWQSVSCPGQSAGIWHPPPLLVLLVVLPVDPPIPPVLAVLLVLLPVDLPIPPVLAVLLVVLLVVLPVDPPIPLVLAVLLVVLPVDPPIPPVLVVLLLVHAATLSSNPRIQ